MSLLRQILRAAQALEGESWAAYEDCRPSRSAVWLRPLAQPTHGDGRKRPLLVVERAWRWGGRGDDCGAVISVGCQRHQDPEPLWSGRLQGRGLASAQRALTEIARDLAALVAWTDANPHLGAAYAHNYVELDLGDDESLTVTMRWRPGGLRLSGHSLTCTPGSPAHRIFPGLYGWSWAGDLAELQALLGASPTPPHTHGAVMTSTPRHTCNGCGAPILFGALRSGKMIPIEPTKVLILPDPTAPSSASGECATILARGQLLVGRLVPPRTPNAVEGPLVHRSRCPGAARTTASGAPVRGHRAPSSPPAASTHAAAAEAAPTLTPPEEPARCWSCKAPTLWRVTPSGKRLPVDLGTLHITPSPEGSTVLVTKSGEVVRGHLIQNPLPGAVAGNIAHFATCPNASQHRKN